MHPLSANIVHFCRYLRARGLDIVPSTATELLRTAELIGLDDQADVRAAFQALTISRPEHRPIFDEAFERFFGSGWRMPKAQMLAPPDEIKLQMPVLGSELPQLDESELDEVTDQVGGSYAEKLGSRDFADMTPEEIAEVRKMIARMMWKPADAQSRRWVAHKQGRRPDMRRTLRNAVGPRSDLLPMEFSARKSRRRPLVVLADVSGSMEKYVEMILYFAHAAPSRMGRVETFVFSTRLTRITHELRRRDPVAALRLVSDSVHDWSGGTRIGESIETFNKEWSRRVARGGPIGVIVSDGWDRGDPRLLSEEMARFHRTMHRVVWLNPLAARPGYAPETQGMKAVLPWVDDFLPAASLNDLGDVIRLLESVPAQRGERRAG